MHDRNGAQEAILSADARASRDFIARLGQQVEPLHPTDSVSDAAQRILLRDLIKMLEHEAGSRSGQDIEDVHQMRVAIRRMRSAIRLLKDAFSDQALISLHDGQLRETGRALGFVRDLDVLIEDVQAAHQEAQAVGMDADPFNAVIKGLEKRRRRARKKLVIYLDSKRYRRFVKDYAAYLTQPSKSGKAKAKDAAKVQPHELRHVVPTLLHEQLAVVRAYDSVIPAPPERPKDGSDPQPAPLPHIDTLHQLRIEIKRLRYATWYFTDVLGASTAKFIDETKRLQDHLGRMNDISVAHQFMEDLIEDDELDADLVRPYLRHMAQESATLQEGFPAAWARFNTRTVQSQLSNALLVLR